MSILWICHVTVGRNLVPLVNINDQNGLCWDVHPFFRMFGTHSHSTISLNPTLHPTSHGFTCLDVWIHLCLKATSKKCIGGIRWPKLCTLLTTTLQKLQFTTCTKLSVPEKIHLLSASFRFFQSFCLRTKALVWLFTDRSCLECWCLTSHGFA